MTVTIPQIMRDIRNGFPAWMREGTWQIQSGTLTPSDALPDEGWVVLEGTACQDGIHQVSKGGVVEGAADERWTGRVWLLAPPEDFLALCRQIIDWAAQAPEAGVLRESFGAYSRTAVTTGGRPVTWQEAFAQALRPYRRMFSEVKL